VGNKFKGGQTMNKIFSWVMVMLLYLFVALFAGLTFATVPVLLKSFTASNLLVVLFCVGATVVSFFMARKKHKQMD